MRKYKLFSILAMFIIGIITLASCSSKITATGELIVLDQTRYTLTIKASLNDEAKEVTQGSVQIQLYNADGDRKTTSNCDKLGGTSEDTTQQVTIQSLDENTPYTVKLVCTIKEHQYTIAQIEAKTNKAGSSHTEAIHITSADDFSKMANDLDGYYILDNDIALGTGNAENEGITEIEKGDLKEWTPVFSSSSSKAFTGTFDGNGHTISNFKQTSSTSDYGFFGYLAEGAQIKNINFENVYLNMTRYSDTYIGVVAGRAESGSSIENVKVSNLKIKVSTSSTSGKTFYVGGLIGQNTGGSIINSTVENLDLNIERGKVVYAGGIAGQNAMAEGKWIENCVVTGKITINQEYNNSSDFTTSTEIVQLIGGVVGKNDGRIRNTISYVNIDSKFNLDDNIVDKVYANKDSEDKSEDAEKEWKINNEINVAIGSFAGYNKGVIRSSAATGSISFESYNAYNVAIGLFCGFNVSEIQPSINHVAYFGEGRTVSVKLTSKEIAEENPKHTKTPEYDRVFKITMIGKEENNQNYFQLPTTYLKSSCEESFGKSTEISQFKGTEIDAYNAEEFNQLIAKLQELF